MVDPRRSGGNHFFNSHLKCLPVTQFSVPVLFKGRKRGETTALGKELDFRGEN
jgi:hypothetical protein